MTQFRILTWNVNGESPEKARCLDQVLTMLVQHHAWQPEVVLIQEANAGTDGAVFDYLARSGFFRAPVYKVPEGGSQSRAYLMAVAHHVRVNEPLQAYSLAQDRKVRDWIARTFPLATRPRVEQEFASFRHLGIADLDVDGGRVRLATWHAPRGSSIIGTAPHSLPANPDAFLALEVSELYGWLTDLPSGVVSAIAGDLNVRQGAIHQQIVLADGQGYELLHGWSGFGRDLDYVLGRAAVDPVQNGFDFVNCTGLGGSDHFIVGATLA